LAQAASAANMQAPQKAQVTSHLLGASSFGGQYASAAKSANKFHM
jgi:hypothetical protein